MCTPIRKTSALGMVSLAATLSFVLNASAASIQTNWVAYNDHAPNFTPVNGWVTAKRVTTYDMRVPSTSGNFTNFFNGSQLPVTMTVTQTGSPDNFGTSNEPNDGTPAASVFKGIVDLSNEPTGGGGVIGIHYNGNITVTVTFNNLNPAKHYIYRGTSVRGGSYPLRWTVATVIGAETSVDAHLNGSGPGVLTSNTFPADLQPGQAAYNAGDNHQGAVVGWDFITPAADGTFSIQSSNYVGHIPGGGLATSSEYSYAICGFLLAEVEVARPAIVSNPAAQTTVEQNRPFSLSVSASGTPLLYQWYKQGVGAIGGATFATYSVSNAALGDSGNYYAVVYNPLASVTSSIAQVTVNADVTPPGIASAFTYPTFDPNTQVAVLNQVVIEFNEAVQPASATDNFAYMFSNGTSPASAVMQNDRTVLLSLNSGLAEDTAYTVTANGVLDLVGNNINSGGANNPASFRSWMRGPGNGLLFEYYPTGAGPNVADLTNSPLFPDSPSFRTNLWGLDSRIVFADDSNDAYGSRTRGVFIPPVTGDWVFYLRSDDASAVYLNPNGTDPAGKQFLMEEVHAQANRDWNGTISSPVHLQAGHGYYIEALHKADVSVDFIKVAVRLEGTGLPTLGVPNSVIDTNALMGGQIGSPLAPRDLGGPLTIQQDLADRTIEENNPITLSLPLTNPSQLPLQYQWFRDGAPIDGANFPTYTIQQPKIANDNGAMFSVQVAKVGSFVTSRTAKLTVVTDVTKPRVTQVFSSYTNLQSLLVTFSEPMDVTASQDQFNYALSGPTIANVSANAVFDSSAEVATLAIDSPLTLGATYSLDIQLCADIAGNVMIETNVSFVVGTDLPKLAVALSGGQAVVSWPAPSTGFVLEQETTPGAGWNPEGSVPVINNGRNTVTVTLPVGAGSKLYRLNHP